MGSSRHNAVLLPPHLPPVTPRLKQGAKAPVEGPTCAPLRPPQMGLRRQKKPRVASSGGTCVWRGKACGEGGSGAPASREGISSAAAVTFPGRRSLRHRGERVSPGHSGPQVGWRTYTGQVSPSSGQGVGQGERRKLPERNPLSLVLGAHPLAWPPQRLE